VTFKAYGHNKSTQPCDPRAVRAGKRIGVLATKKFGNLTKAAEAMQCSYWTLYRVSRGKSAPTADFVAMAARHFSLSIDWLMR
jgi:hypothetical protein